MSELREQADAPAPIVVGGGGANLAAWPHIIADILNNPVEVVPQTDLSACGAAMLGWGVAGHQVVVRHEAVMCQPRRELAAVWGERRGRLRRERPAPVMRTVTGDIETTQLGFTYSHEHLIGAPPQGKRVDDDLVILDYEPALAEAKAALSVGVKTLYEASAWDYSRDPENLRRISRETGLQIIGCAGLNKGQWFDSLLADCSVGELRERVVTISPWAWTAPTSVAA